MSTLCTALRHRWGTSAYEIKSGGQAESRLQQVTIYGEPAKFAGWPANYGMWAWGDELVVGFTVSSFQVDARFHARDRSKPSVTMQARSLDGGRTWTVGPFPGRTPGGRGLSADEHMIEGLKLEEVMDGPEGPGDIDKPIDFLHEDFAFMCARTGLEPGVQSFFYYSYDRAKSWNGPYRLPQFVHAGVAARTDYVVVDKDHCILFLTANKFDGEEGRVFCAETRDGAMTWKFVNWIGEELWDKDHGIMPASLRLANGDLLVAVRAGHGQDYTIETYRSTDLGRTWSGPKIAVAFKDNAKNHLGNPATLNLLPDGRIAMTYGNRDAPYTIDAKLSDDGGDSWGETIHLRKGGGSHDIGYPRTVAAADGTLVTAYYFNESADRERFIGATRWRP